MGKIFKVTPGNDAARANRELRRAMQLRPGERSVWASFLGSIPAEESDEEFAAAIKAMNRFAKEPEGIPERC